MSIKAMSLVFERSRAKAGQFSMLLAIADYAKDDGGGAWPAVSTLAWKARLTPRGARFTLARLVQDGEVWPEWDAVERRLYLQVRCVSEWVAYQQEGLAFERGREKFSDSQREIFSLRLVELGATRRLMCQDESEKGKSATGPSSSTDPRTDPLEEDPSPRARETRPPRPRIEAYVDVWNGSTTPPIPRCDTITKTRRRLLEVLRLQVAPEQWAMICATVEASPFLRGANDRGWKASLDWLLTNDQAIPKILEGHFDDRPPPRRPPGPQPTAAFACPLDRPCHGRSACQLKTDLAAAKAKAS